MNRNNKTDLENRDNQADLVKVKGITRQTYLVNRDKKTDLANRDNKTDLVNRITRQPLSG